MKSRCLIQRSIKTLSFHEATLSKCCKVVNEWNKLMQTTLYLFRRGEFNSLKWSMKTDHFTNGQCIDDHPFNG